MSQENILSGMFEPLTAEMEEEVQKLTLKGEELRLAAERSGIAGIGTEDPTEGFDETVVADTESDEEKETESDDEWGKALPPTVPTKTNPQSPFPSASGTSPQMTKEIMSASVESMKQNLKALKIAAPPSRSNKERVDEWAGSTKQKLGRAATEMLVSALDTHPSADDNTLQWILCGWNMRGDHNVVEVRNVHQAIQELINGGIAQQRGFKTEASGIITGFKDCQKDIQKLVHGMKEALTVKPPQVSVPLGKIQPEAQSSTSNVTQKQVTPSSGKHTPHKDVEKDKRMLMKKLAKRPDDMLKFCSGDALSQILHDIVVSMTAEDWEALETMSGKVAMNKVLAEEINTRVNH